MLKQKAKSAVLWSGADILLRQGLQFGISIALARMLSPEEFGTIALLYLFTGIASAFVDSGFSSALIQRQDVNHIDESTVFWFNLGIGLLVALGLYLIAPAISSFYTQPILEPLTGLMALNVLLSAFGSIHGTLLTKSLDFRLQMKAGGIATAVSGGVAIVMALKGFGIWALAVQTLVATLLTTVLLWWLSPWRPGFVFSMLSVRKLFGFGGYMLASGLLDITYNRLYTLLIGKFYGVRELGFYSRADGTKQLPVGVLTSVLSRVALPIFSAAAGNVTQLRRGVQLSVRVMMLINVPMMLGLMAVAKPLVETLFGSQWLPAVPILQVLCLAGLFWPLHVINLNVLMAQGHSRLFFRLEMIKKVLGLGLLIGGSFYGVMGVAWSQVMFGALAYVINAYYTERFLAYGVFAQLTDVLPVVGVSIVMGAILFTISIVWTPHPFLALLGLVVVGLIIFFGLGMFFGINAMHETLRVIGSRKVKIST